MSTCNDATNDINNALYPAEAGKAVVLLEYGPYMNWGRWNENPSRVNNLVTALIANLPGVGVQLAFDPKKDKHPNTHGWVIVSVEDNGEKKVIYEAEDYQHNRNYHTMASTAITVAQLCKKVVPGGEVTERE